MAAFNNVCSYSIVITSLKTPQVDSLFFIRGAYNLYLMDVKSLFDGCSNSFGRFSLPPIPVNVKQRSGQRKAKKQLN